MLLNGVAIHAYQVYVELGQNTILFTKIIKNNSENIYNSFVYFKLIPGIWI